MIHASKRAFVAVKSHRDAYGRFEAGDVVIVDDEALVEMLVREGSIDPNVVVDAGMFTSPPSTPTESPQAGTDQSPAAASDRMTRGPGGRRGRARVASAPTPPASTPDLPLVTEASEG